MAPRNSIAHASITSRRPATPFAWSAESIGLAAAAISAPSARHFAASNPVVIPPEATRVKLCPCVRSIAASLTASAVGMPQSQKCSPTVRSFRRSVSTPVQLVPPAPATSIQRTPASSRRPTTSAERPAPISLTMTGMGRERTNIAIPSKTPRNLGFPSGCMNSWGAFKWTANASA